MATPQPLEKPAVSGAKPPREKASPRLQPPQIHPPLLVHGPELMRDPHC
jgi:hypothetical protein